MKNALLLNVFLILLTAYPLSAQLDTVRKNTGMGRQAPSEMTRPTFEASDSGIHMKIWIMSKLQESGYNDITTAQNNNDGEPQQGTHHIMVDLKEAVSGKDIESAKITLQATSPSQKTMALDLTPMGSQYGGNLALDEKGSYELSVNIDQEGKAITFPLKYIVK